MYKIEEIPFFLWMLFMTVYFAIGDPNNDTWIGSFYVANYTLIIWAFIVPKNNVIKNTGIFLSLLLILFAIIRFFLHLQIDRSCAVIFFLIAIIIQFYVQFKRE